MLSFIIIIIIGIAVILWLGSAFYIAQMCFKVVSVRNNTWYKTQGRSLISPESTTSNGPNYKQIEQAQVAHGNQYWDTHLKEEVMIYAHDRVKLYGSILEADARSKKWALCIHGYRSTGKIDIAFVAMQLAQHGFNALVPDQRAHGKSEGNYIGLGGAEYKDVHTWVIELLRRQPDAEILLYGDSMGAATVMMSLKAEYPLNVKAIIADCGYTSIHDELAYLLKRVFKVPAFIPVIPFFALLYKINLQANLYGGSSLKGLQNNQIPIQFIHGGGDDFVPPEMTTTNAATTKGEKEVLIVPHAPHFSSYIYDEKTYFDTIALFVKKYF